MSVKGMKLVQIGKSTKLAAYLILTLLAGCATMKPHPDKTLLDFLEDGKTSKQMVISKLGQPLGILKRGKVLHYQIGNEENSGYFLLTALDVPTTKTKFNLALLFDENNVLQKHYLSPYPSKTLLDFLEDGKTSKQMVISKLGISLRTYEGERFFTYRIGREKKMGYFLLEDWDVPTTKTKFNLALIFDKNNVLQKHSLNPYADKTSLDFLEDGKTSKQTVILKLGWPPGTYEGEKIFTYRIGSEKKKEYFLLEDWDVRTTKTKFNLVLIFDENNVLQEHSLNPYADKTLLDFLEDGKTSKQMVILKLGMPSGTYEGDRIFTYRIRGKKKKGYILAERWAATKWAKTKFSLVLIFDENNVLKKHSLVKVR